MPTPPLGPILRILIGESVQMMGLKLIAEPLKDLEGVLGANGPVLLCILRGSDVAKRLGEKLALNDEFLVSEGLENAVHLLADYKKVFRVIAHAFLDAEICADGLGSSQHMYFAPRQHTITDLLFQTSSNVQRCCVVIKPVSAMKKLVALLRRSRRDDFVCLGIEMRKLSRNVVPMLVADRSKVEEETEYMTSGASVC